MKRLWLLHFAGNAVLIGLIYWWLGIGDARGLQILTTIVLGLAILFAVLWLQAGSFAWFREQQPPALGPSFRIVLPKLPAFGAAALLSLLVYLGIEWLDSRAYPPAVSIASWLTFHIRKPIPPLRIYQGFHAGLWAIRWLILPSYLLPLASAVAAHSWLGFRLAGTQTLPRFYWPRCVALTLAAFYLPGLLIHWVPDAHGIALQTTSFALRFLTAYCLFVTAWLLLLFFSSGGRPRVSQPVTAALP